MTTLSLAVSTNTYIPFKTGPLKRSMYNFLLPPDRSAPRGALVYNALSGAAAELSDREHALLERFSDRGGVSASEVMTNLAPINDLFTGGYLVPVALDEPKRVLEERLYWRDNRDHLDLTIAPTLGCNFRCTYCFQHRSNLSFSEDDRIHLVRFYNEVIGAGTKSVVVHWYGGEPTLRIDDIRQLTPPLLALRERFGFKFLSEIYTNAWELDEATCESLSGECAVSTLMISLDGPRDIHDKMRRGPGGIGCFDEIMKRVALCLRFFHVKLRIHCHTGNDGRIEELLDHLHALGLTDLAKEYGKTLYLHFSKLYDFSEACKHVKQIRIPHEEWGRLQGEYMEYAQALGFRVNWLPKRVIGKYCNAQRKYAYIVAPRGYIYKCYREDFFAPESSVGKITDKVLPDVVVPGQDATDRSECQDCYYLPICSGFCPSSSWAESPCTHLKGNLNTRLLGLWKQRQAGIEESANIE